MSDLQTYKGATFVDVGDEDTLEVYDTSKPTPIGTWEDGIVADYRFMNGEAVLDSGTVKDGETPVYKGATPTKEATAQYTYTFNGWSPTVGPIYVNTDYIAQFSSTVNEYDLTITVNDNTRGSVNVASVEGQPYGTAISANENVLTIGTGASATVITATAESGYVFSSWGTLPATVTEDLTITATFAAIPSHPLTMTVNNVEWGSITSQSYDDVHIGDVITYDGGSTGGNIKCNNDNVSIVSVESGYQVQTVQGVPATYDGTPITVSVIFEAVPPLLTYSELKALGTAQAILAELNTNDEGYYASLTAEGHIYNQSEGGTTIAGIAEVVGQTQETTVPLIVDGGAFVYVVEGNTAPGFELHTWYWQGVSQGGE